MDGIEEEFRHLFNQRKKGFDILTQRIFDLMKIALSGVIEHLSEKKEHFDGSNFKWVKVSLVAESDMVYFVGEQTHKVGTNLSWDNGASVEITEENAPYFNRTFEVGLPVKMALSKDIKEVKEFLTRTADKYEGKLKDLIDTLINKGKPTVDSQEDEFDFNLLSEQQKKHLVKIKKGKKLN